MNPALTQKQVWHLMRCGCNASEIAAWAGVAADVAAAMVENAERRFTRRAMTRRELERDFGMSRATAYRWLAAYREAA